MHPPTQSFYSFKLLYWSCLTANQWFMPSWGSPSWETAMDSWHCLFSMHLMMGIKYGNSWNRPIPAGATHDAYPIICLHSLTRLALPVNTITRECGSLTRPKQPCVSPMVTADVTKGRTEIFKFDAQCTFCGRAVPYTTRLVLLAEDFGCPYLLCILILLVMKLEYSGITRSMPWLLMPWLLALPCHLQQCYWLPHQINRSLSSTRKDFNYRCHFSFIKWQKMQIYFYVCPEKIKEVRG